MYLDLRERVRACTTLDPERGCWLWRKSKDSTGYGHLRTERGLEKAHRFAYRIFVGEVPEGLLVCHKCDTPACCNPAHLFLGTAADNAHDRDTKGRQRPLRGEAHGRAVLSAQVVRRALSEIATGPRGTARRLARELGVSDSAISNAKRRRSWRDA